MFRSRGIIPAMVTPFDDQDRVDAGALAKLTRYLLDAGVHGLFCAGSQGESYALTYEEKKTISETVIKEAAGSVPVYVGTGAVTTGESVKLTQMAEACGADAVTVITPYFIAPSQDELYQHYAAIARSTRLPVFLYSNPSRTGVSISPALIGRLSKIENIAGIKDSSGDLTLTMSYIGAGGPDFNVLMGRDTLIYASLCCGARGAVAATANVVPALAVSIYERFQKGDHEGALRAQFDLEPVRTAFNLGTFPVVVKEALTMMGIPMGPCRAPVGDLPESKKEELKAVLRRMGLI